jgi:VCBS repeat-containing protein
MQDSAGNELKVGDEVTVKFKVVGISGEQGEFRNLHLSLEGKKETRAVINAAQATKVVEAKSVKAVDAK